MKSPLHYCHAAYYSGSYVVKSVHEYFAVTDSHLQISQHQVSLKHENIAVSSDGVSRPIFASLGLGLEGFRS